MNSMESENKQAYKELPRYWKSKIKRQTVAVNWQEIWIMKWSDFTVPTLNLFEGKKETFRNEVKTKRAKQNSKTEKQ